MKPTNILEVPEIKDCARCGGEHRGPLFFRRMQRAFAPAEASPKEWTHVFTCPRTGDPVLLAVLPEETEAAPSPEEQPSCSDSLKVPTEG